MDIQHFNQNVNKDAKYHRPVCHILVCANTNEEYAEGIFNTFSPRQNGDIFKISFLYENCCILIPISLKFVPEGQIDNNPALVEITARRRSGDKPLSWLMMD